MKKVLLMGDDIHFSYEERVKELLADVCEVISDPCNARYTANALWLVRDQIELTMQLKDIDLIHWNTGLWDHYRTMDDGAPLVSAEHYLYYNRRYHRQLASYADRLIWATTTPAGDGYPYDPNDIYGIPKDEWNREVTLYNDLLIPYLKHEGVVINDLHALVSANPDYLSEDGIHLSDKGAEAAAQQTAAMIRELLNTELGEGAKKEQTRRDSDEACHFNW